MSSEKENPEYIRPALYVGNIILSIVGLILVAVDGIGGWWWGPGYSNYYFSIDTTIAAPWGQIVHILLIFGFLFTGFVSLQLLYPVLKLTDERAKKFEKAGFFAALGVLSLTILSTIIFAIVVRGASEMWLDSGFYAGVIGGILVSLFFWLANKAVISSK
jgi:hypothetical protein